MISGIGDNISLTNSQTLNGRELKVAFVNYKVIVTFCGPFLVSRTGDEE